MKEVEYTDGWGYYDCSPLAAEDLAMMNGAVQVGYYYTTHWYTGTRELSTGHFFDIHGEEVGMYSYTLHAVMIFNKPRRWGKELKSGLSMVPLSQDRRQLLRESELYELRDGKMVARSP